MPSPYIPYQDPYSIPSNFTETKTLGGGTAYLDPQGNKYVRDTGGFKFLPSESPKMVQTPTII